MINIILWTILILMILFPVVMYCIQKRNIKYYMINGRKPKEIRSWLIKQKWFDHFIYNIKQEAISAFKDDDGSVVINDEVQEYIKKSIAESLDGSCNTHTISSAFCWTNTPEGIEYWGAKDKKFLKWYFGQYVDLHF